MAEKKESGDRSLKKMLLGIVVAVVATLVAGGIGGLVSGYRTSGVVEVQISNLCSTLGKLETSLGEMNKSVGNNLSSIGKDIGEIKIENERQWATIRRNAEIIDRMVLKERKMKEGK